MSHPQLIELDRFRSKGVRVFAGRERGKEVRRVADLNALDNTSSPVNVYVPLDTLSVNGSFFLGLFGHSIRRLGESGFREHYTFSGKNIERTVSECIEEALNTTSPL